MEAYIKVLTILFLGTPISPPAAGNSESIVEDFAHYLAQWRGLNETDYAYEMRRIGSAAGSGVLVEIMVRDSRVRDIRYQESSDYTFRNWDEGARQTVDKYAVGDVVDRREWHSYPAIHDLYGIIAASLAQPVASIDVTYNKEFGYPSKVTIDPHEMIVDEKITYVVQNLVLLEVDKPK